MFARTRGGSARRGTGTGRSNELGSTMRAPMPSLADLRTEYRRATLDEHQVSPDPFDQFARWLDEARAADLPEVNAMTLATVASDARPQARIVLLKAFDPRGFVFFTNTQS